MPTRLAIKPGTRDGYITAGGENGGYIYRFRALADGAPVQRRLTFLTSRRQGAVAAS